MTDERFDRFGPEELPALARKIGIIAVAAPDFAVEVYRSTYSREVTDNRKTSLSGSRILNLTSNAKQDLESARWSLGEYFSRFLTEFPVEATKAFLAAMAGYVARRHPISERPDVHVIEGPAGYVQLQPDHSFIWAHEPHPLYAEDGEVLLSKFLAFLKTGEEHAVLAAAEYAARRDPRGGLVQVVHGRRCAARRSPRPPGPICHADRIRGRARYSQRRN